MALSGLATRIMRFAFWIPAILLLGLAPAAPAAANPFADCVKFQEGSGLVDCVRDALPPPSQSDGGGGGPPAPDAGDAPCPAPNDGCPAPSIEQEARHKASEAGRAADSLRREAPPSESNEAAARASEPAAPPQAPAPDDLPVEPDPAGPDPVVALVPKAQLRTSPLPDLLNGAPEREAEPESEPATIASAPADLIVETVPALFLAPKALSPVGTIVALTFGVLVYAFALFYNRLSRDKVLESDVRKRIVRELSLRPGRTCAEIARELGVHYTTAVHHMRILEKFGKAVAHRTSSQLTFFQRDGSTPPASRAEIVALRRPATAALLEAARRHGSFRTRQIAGALGIPRSTAGDRIRILVCAGLLERSPHGYRLTSRAFERRSATSAPLSTTWTPSAARKGPFAGAQTAAPISPAPSAPASAAASSGPT